MRAWVLLSAVLWYLAGGGAPPALPPGLSPHVVFPPPVNPFAPRWKGTCNESVDCEDTTNHNILQVRISARDRIEEFFRRQAYIFKHDFKKTLPAMHFVDHSFHIMRMDSCRPGFGKNEGLHSNCASCC
ncbi:Zona pellucida-binding protein 2, partial [Camelus dromedarius]